MTKRRWLRAATLGLFQCAYERDQQWRERFYSADALLRTMAGELGTLKADWNLVLIRQAKRDVKSEGHQG